MYFLNKTLSLHSNIDSSSNKFFLEDNKCSPFSDGYNEAYDEFNREDYEWENFANYDFSIQTLSLISVYFIDTICNSNPLKRIISSTVISNPFCNSTISYRSMT